MPRKDEIFLEDGDQTTTLKKLAASKGIGYVTLFIRYKKLLNASKVPPTASQVIARPRQGRPPEGN